MKAVTLLLCGNSLRCGRCGAVPCAGVLCVTQPGLGPQRCGQSHGLEQGRRAYRTLF